MADKVTNLYNAFINNGYAMESEAQFRENLKDPNKRKAAYDALVADGYNMEPFNEFESNIGYGAPAPTSAPQQEQSTATSASTATPAPTAEQEQAPVQAAEQAWQPTEQEKIRMSYNMHTMLNDFNQKSRARVEQTRRMTERISPEGRKKLKDAKFQAQLAGTPTSVMGLTPNVSAAPADGQQGATDGADAPKPLLSGQSPVPYGVVIENGERKTQWLLPDGSLTTSLTEADQAEFSARTVRLRHQFEERMKQNGLDPAKQEDVQKQAQLDYEAPMRKVINQAWAQAEKEDKAADEEYREKMSEYNKSLNSNVHAISPDGMPIDTPQENLTNFNRAVKRKETFNLEQIADKVYTDLPESYRNSQLQVYNDYFSTHTDELNGRSVETAAEDALKGDVYQAVYQRAVDSQMPKSKTEFFWRKVAEQISMSPFQSMDVAASAMTNSWGMRIADQAAMSQYGQDHKFLNIAGTVAGFAFDPLTVASIGVGSAAGKVATNVVGKMMLKKMTEQGAKGLAERFAARTLTGRLTGAVASGAANFSFYETAKNIQQQISTGGMPDLEAGKSNGYSVGEIIKAAGRGFILGGVSGGVSTVIGNVADKAVEATANTYGKIGIRTGEIAVSSIAEGTVFSLPEWISGEGDAFDVWSDNMGMVLGFKVSHGIKSAPRVIASLRPIKPVKGKPLTQPERNHNRMDFEERVRKALDPANINNLTRVDDDGRVAQAMRFTADELEELRRAGYGELSDLFSKDRVPEVQRPNINPAEGAMELSAEHVEAEVGRIKYGEETVEETPIYETNGNQIGVERKVSKAPDGFDVSDGYSAMEKLMQDSRVSQAVRAKAYFIISPGRMLPMSTVTGYTSIKGEDGSVIINSMSSDGEVVTSRKFANEKSAQQEVDNIMRQAELNSVDVGERYAEAIADDMVLSAAVNEVSPGADPETVKRIYRAVKAGNKDVNEEQVQLAEFIDDAIARNKDIADAQRPEAIREAIKEESGIDVDAALRKSPTKRTEAEQEAVKSYLVRLFPEELRQKAEEPTPEQTEAQNQYEQGRALFSRYEEADPTAPADIDAIALRMQEAYQGVEDAFGTEAEYYMFHITENPWGLLNDPELTVEQQDAVLYYINAKAALDGVMDASNEVADRKRNEVQQAVEKRTHKDNGVIIPATMKVDDRQVYVVKGDIVMFPDGTGIDTRNSSESVVVMDAQTGKYEFTSPDQILKVSDAVEPQEELETAMSVIEQEQMSMFGENALASEEPAKQEQIPIDESVPNPMGNAVSSPGEAAEPMTKGEIVAEPVPNEESGQQTALSRIPVNEQGEPMFEAVDKDTAWDGLIEAVGAEADAADIAMAQVKQATTDLEALKKKPPTLKAPKLKGSAMAMAKAKKDAQKLYEKELGEYNQQVADTQARLDAWNGILGVYTSRNAELRRQQEEERRQRDAEAHDAAVAQFEEQQRIKAEKKTEQERVGVHAVNPKIKEKWDTANKIEGNPDAITLPDGSSIRGRYVLTEAGAASASHDVNNAYEPTEGFPIDENGQSVNDRDYLRDKDAQRIVEQMAGAYDNRALQTPVIVSKDGVVLSGNNRTMSGDLAARQGTDNAYVDYLREFGHKYGFTPEQVQGMSNPRLVFVPDENLPYDAITFSRFNAQEMKSQSKPEAAVKLGKIVPDNVFTDIANDISRYDLLSDYYADEKAVAHALGALMHAGVINDKQMPEMRTGTALSAAGKELIENTLIGKVFQISPDAARQIISMPTLRQSIVMGLNEIANTRTLARNGYDISEELTKAVDLVSRAKAAMPDVYTDGMPVSPFGRMQGLFDDEFGDSRVTDATALLLADILNSGKPSDLRKVLASYNNEAAQASGGQIDIFSGSIPTKEEILTNVNEHFRNATPKEQQALVDAAIAERKRRAEAEAEQRGRDQESEQTPYGTERGAEPQQPAAIADEKLTPEEQALAARIEVTDNDWTEGEGDKPTYKREIIIDGTHKATQVDAPDEDGQYTGSYFEFDGKHFGDIAEITQYIDGGMKPEPTEAQKAAGNYKMEHRRIDGYNISIENVKGSVRRGTGADGKTWETTMHNDYGYIRGTEGVDGDHIDVFLSDTPEEGDVFVIDQRNEDGSFDEHKVMYGFPSEEAAREAYLSNYDQGWTGLGAITHVSKDEFKKWIGSSKRKTKPFADYKNIKTIEVEIGRSLTEEEATSILSQMENIAEEAPDIAFTPENWKMLFGEDGKTSTPIGVVKMGENQYGKLALRGRTSYFGMIHPTLTEPHVIIEKNAPAKEAERNSKYLFVRTFKKPNGGRIVHFESITVMRDGMEVSISSHEATTKDIKKDMQNEKILHITENLSLGSEKSLTEAPKNTEGPDLVPTSDNNISDGKDNALLSDEQGKEAESSDGYTITPTTYTNKAGKTTPMHSIQFSTPPTYEQRKALAAFAREKADGRKSRGWCSDKDTYSEWLFRSEEDARKAGEMIADQSGEAVADAQPMTAEELREAVAPAPSTEKPAKQERKPKKAPINRVSLEDVMTDLNTKGETQLSDHAEPIKAAPEVQHEISDDEMQSLANELRDLLGIGEDEGDAGIKFRDPGELTPQERQRIQSAGIRLAMGLFERGTTSFPDYATKMVGLLGDKIRPWLKSFYEGARWTPGYENIAFTPSEEVARFDVQNFDKSHYDVFKDAEMRVEERKAQTSAEQAEKELKEIRNKQRKERESSGLHESQDSHNGYSIGDEVMWDRYGNGKLEKVKIEDFDTDGSPIFEAVKGIMSEKGDWSRVKPADGIFGEAKRVATKVHTERARKRHEDNQGNPVDGNGKLILEEVKSIDDITDEDFMKPSRNIGLPKLPDNVAEAIGLDGRNVIIKKSIFEKNRDTHGELTPQDSRDIFSRALYSPNLVGATQPIRRPDYRVAIQTGDKNAVIVLDVYKGKDNVEIVGWRKIDAKGLEKMKRQSEREGGQFLILSPSVGSAAALSALPSDISSENKQAEREGGHILTLRNSNVVGNTSQGLSSEGKITNKKSKEQIKYEQPIGDLFGGLFDEPISTTTDEKKTDVQPRPGAAERERGHEPQPNETLGESQRNEVKGTDGRGMDRRDSVNPDSDGERGAGVSRKPASQEPLERLPEAERMNSNNNHAERGTDYAPKGEDARIKANIEAIQLAKQLLDAGEQATPEHMAVLRRFSGWGGLGKAFNEDNAVARQLRRLLTEDEYKTANDSRNSAYYTPAEVIDTMWDVVRAMGFKGGNVLEGSAGIGNILGLMPADFSDRSNIHAVEVDHLTGGILSLLYPDAKVDIQGFEDTKVRNNSVDLAITNVPFITDWHVMDKTGDKDLSKKFRDIHDFCIAKNIRKLREGGIGIFITSSGTMDNSARLRQWITSDGNADVVGAFRMHNKTFGGTGATSDIIVVRKRVNGKPSPNAINIADVTGLRTADYDTGDTRKVAGQEVPIIKNMPMEFNKYFVEHPENMAGEMMFNFERGETWQPTSKSLFPTVGKDQSAMLKEWAGKFAGMKPEDEVVSVEDAMTRINERLGEDVKEGSMVLNSKGELCVARMGEAEPIKVNKNKVKGQTKAECFQAYTAIKKALKDVLDYQSSHDDDAGLTPLLNELNNAFDSFTRTYGNLHKNTAISFLRNDVDFSSILALETYSEKGDKKGSKVIKVGKTDIFSRRVIETEKEPQPDNIKDGILASLYKSGGVDVDYIADALGKTPEDVRKEIVESGLGFENPATGVMEVSYQYLSGNVRDKLHIAEENNENGRYEANIKALQGTLPMTIPAHLIEFSLGSSWIDHRLYEAFVEEKTGVNIGLTNAGGTWFMKRPWSTFTEKNRAMGVVSKMCGKTIMGDELIEAAITNKTITVSKTERHHDGSTETITDSEATRLCATKVDEIRSEFKDWARARMQTDSNLAETIERTYNEQFNNYVPMSIPEEFVPTHFGGQVSELHGRPFALRPHQSRAVVRAMTQPVLLAHEVGTGKTYTLITTSMEMRRLGTARKPMIVVQNATVGQFVESAKEIYPNAKVLTIEEADRTADGRRNFYAKIKYNDWDMIVVPQSVFERIPDSEEREMAYVKSIIEEKMKVLEAMKEADSQGKSMIVRQAEKDIDDSRARLSELTEALQTKRAKRDAKREAKTKQNAEVKALEMLDREVDDVENFDDMGIDAILVDEAHEYKHLGFATAMQRGVKGIDPSFSKKSQGVYLKAQAVLEHNNGRNVVFATGTPISNTAAEIWTFMRYLMPADTMKAYGIYYFDDFVRNFGNISQMVEFTTSGKFKENNRFAGYINLPELVRIWSSVADTVLTREAGGVSDKIPDIEGGKPTDIYLPQTRALRSIMKYVNEQLKKYDEMTGQEKKENSHIPLVMYGIAKAAAVDARLVLSDAPDEPNSKTNATVRETLRSLKDSERYKGTVAIFADNYQNKQSGFNLYEDIRTKLIDQDVPAEQIVIIKSGMTVKKKLDIFEKVNAGEIRVIMGSTFTLGTGVNIQERLHTLIHVDAPNRPMDYTQRNGRGARQGNLHKDMDIPIRILRFGVEDSLDVTAYQRLKTKGAIADSIMNGSKMMKNSMENRVLEEEEDVFGDMTAQLSGSEYAILKNQAERDVRSLTAKQKQHEVDQIYIHNKLPEIDGFIRGAERRIEIETSNLKAIAEHWPDGKIKKITIGKMSFDSVVQMEDFFKEQNAKLNKAAEEMKQGGDEYTSTLPINIDGMEFVVTSSVKPKVTGGGQLSLDLERSVSYSCLTLGIEDFSPSGQRLKAVMQDIEQNIATGERSKGLLSRGQSQLSKYTEERTQLEARKGKEFPFSKELAEAKTRLAEYEEAMKKEMAEKEAKYAEMDKSVDTATDISLDDDSEDVSAEAKFRDGDSDGERLRAIRALEPIEVEPNNMSKAELREIYNNLPTVNKNGREIEFYHSAFKKIYKDGSLFGQVVPVLDEVLEQSVLAYSEEDNLGGMVRPDGTIHKEHPNTLSFDNYVGKVDIDGIDHYVRITIQHDKGDRNGMHSCFVTEVEIYENTGFQATGTENPRVKPYYSGIVDAKLQQFFERASTEALELDKVDRVNELSEKLGVSVKIISDKEDIDNLPSARHRRSKGWWSEDSGVVIVLPNNVNVADVDNTVVHEVVGHKGLRALIGAERFDDFLGEVYSHASNPIRKVIDKMTDDMVSAEADRLRVRKSIAHERAGEDVNSHYYVDMAEARLEAEQKREQFRKDATEEYMSDLGGRIGSEGFEKMSRDELTLWGKIKAKVQSFLDKLLQGLKIAKSIRLNDKDLSYILFKSWKNMREKQGKGGVFADAEDAVMRRRTGWDDAMLSESAKVEDANNRLNRELQQQIDGTLSDGHIYQLGNPGMILRSTGVPNLPIQMSATRLRVKATEYGHVFDLAEIRNLVKELQTPMAVFAYGNKGKMQNIIVGIESNGKQFIVGLSLNPIVNGKALEINSIRNVFPKNNAEWLNWISQGKLLYADKQKIQALIDKQRTILTDVAYLDLEDVAKIIKTFENPTFDGDEDVRFRDGADYVERVPVMARAMYEKQIQSSMYQFTEAMRDSMRGLLEFYKAVESQGAKRDIEDVASFENAYITENLMSSKSHAEMEEYEHRILRPLLDIAARMSVNKRGRQELLDYMMAKHGLERNAYMRNEAIANGEESERDFAGLCGLTGEQDWQDAETAAQQIVDDYEAVHSADVGDFWNAVNKATTTSLKKVYDCGLLSKEQYEKIRVMYDYYIPLRGFDEKTSDDVYGYLTSKGGAFSSPIKKAEGRKSKADDPLATIAYMAQNSIIQGNRNVMKQKFLTYVQNHPSDLASVNRLWLVHDETMDVWKPVFANVDENMTPDEINKAVMNFEQRMESLSQSEPDKYKRGRDAIGIPYRMVDGNIKEHQVLVKRNGESFVITINGNPRAAQAINGLTNPDNDLNGAIGKVFNLAGIVNRQLSQFYTTRNPDFVVSNFIRDLMYSNSIVHIKENQRYAMKFHKNHAKVNPVRMVRLLHLYDTNKLDMNKSIHRMFYEFMHWGGETGYTMQRDLEKEKQLVTRLIKEARRGILNPMSILNLIGKKLDQLNRGVENSARFAAFLTSRESGRDVQRSVYDAKEISVNFNKKGTGSKFMDAKGQTVVGKTAGFISSLGRSFYIFWNAAVQGTSNFTKAFKKHPGRAIMATTALMLLGYIIAALSDDEDDEDKNGYYNVSKYTRRSNMMFRYGEQWITIPLPVEYRALYGLGELAYSVTSGREEYSDAELAKETASQLSQLLPLDFMEGGGGLYAFVPSAFKPLVESATNTSWTGQPIYKDTPFNKDMPEWTKAYPRTNTQLIDLSKWANEASGGNDYKTGWANFNPARLEYLLNGYFGGYYNVINKMVKTGEQMLGEREYDPSSILLVNRLVKMGDERTAEKKMNADFFKYLEEYRRTHTLLRKYEEEADRGSDKYSIFLDALKHSRDGARHDVMVEYIADYNWLNRAIKDPDCPDEERAIYETDMRRLKREVVSLMKVAHDSVQMERLKNKFALEHEQQ